MATKENAELYACAICGLHYKNKKIAEECYAWCSTHRSCKLSVARQSEEATRGTSN